MKLIENDSKSSNGNKNISRSEFLKCAIGGALAGTLITSKGYGLVRPEANGNKRLINKRPRGVKKRWSLLRAGEIKPKGWIAEEMRLDLYEGLTGNYDQISPNVNLKLFEKQERYPGTKVEMPLRGEEKAWWAGEHEGYWKDAVIRTAFLIDAPEYKQRAHKWIESILAAQDEDGYIGIYSKKGRFPQKGFDGELWTQSRIFQALLAYYEFTGERSVLEAVEKAVELTLAHYQDNTYFGRPNAKGGGIPHGVGFMDSLEWLYRLTGKDLYKEGAVWLYDDFSASNLRETDMRLTDLLDRRMFWEGHTPHIVEGLHMPQVCYAFTDEEKYSEAADNALAKLDIHTNPGGGIVGDERVGYRKGGGDVAGEYCSVTESTTSLNRIFSYRKDFRVGDRVERGALNHAQGARFHPANRASLYLARDNQMTADNPAKASNRYVYAATHKAADCCSLNSTRLMPYYIEGMWYKAMDRNALVANLYGPSYVKTKIEDTFVEIVEKTNYPFSDEILFELKPDKPIHFTLILRVPEAQNNLYIDAPGGAVKRFAKHIEVSKRWQSGDTVRIDFNFEVELRVDQHGERYYQRGPLVFALPFPEIRKKSMEFKQGDNPSGFYRHLIQSKNTTGWEYKIDPETSFTLINLPKGDMKHPWANPPVALKGRMINKKGKKIDVTLLPEGATHLRRVTFPLVGD